MSVFAALDWIARKLFGLRLRRRGEKHRPYDPARHARSAHRTKRFSKDAGVTKEEVICAAMLDGMTKGIK